MLKQFCTTWRQLFSSCISPPQKKELKHEQEKEYSMDLAAYKMLLREKKYTKHNKRTVIAMNEALENPVILANIIETMDLPDLLTSRSVSQKWKSTSSKILLQNDLCKVKTCSGHSNPHATSSALNKKLEAWMFNFRPNSIPNPLHLKKYSLSTLTTILEKSDSNFPATTFVLYDVNIGTPEVQQFFQKYGHKIRTLHLIKVSCDSYNLESSDPRTRQIGINSSSPFPSTYTRVKNEIFTQLLQSIPNLEHLTGGQSNFKWSPFQLSTLESFTFNSNQLNQNPRQDKLLPNSDIRHPSNLVMAHNILAHAVNLNLIQNFHLESDTGLLSKLGKIHLVQRLTVDLSNWSSSPSSNITDRLIEFCSGQPRLQQLHLDKGNHLLLSVKKSERQSRTQLQKLVAAIESLFELSVETLVDLKIGGFLTTLKIKLPTFEKLKSLQIDVGKGEERFSQFLPDQLDLIQTFPHLCRLDCRHLPTWDGDSWYDCFPDNFDWTGKFPSVQTLDVIDDCVDKWLANLLELCPNFNRLRIHVGGHVGGNGAISRYGVYNSRTGDGVEELLPKIFSWWDHLVEIQIFFKNSSGWEGRNGEQDFPHLDSAFTGLSREYCEEMRRRMDVAWVFESTRCDENEGDWDDEDFEHYKENLSLVDMEGLRKLRLVFDTQWAGMLSRKNVPLSVLSGLFAFKLVEDLTTTICFDHNCPNFKDIRTNLQPMESYVNFQHLRFNTHFEGLD